MIDRTHQLPVSHQARVLGLSRGGIYYQPVSFNENELSLMHRLDQRHLASVRWFADVERFATIGGLPRWT